MKPAISLPVYFKSVKKWKYVLRKNKNKKQKDQKRRKEKKKFPTARVKPRTSDVKISALFLKSGAPNEDIVQNHLT